MRASAGKTFLVKNILGADELYDAVKFQVEVPKKAVFLPIAAEPVANGTNAYLLLYSTGKNATFKSGVITEVSKLKDPYKYYKMPADDSRKANKKANAARSSTC